MANLLVSPEGQISAEAWASLGLDIDKTRATLHSTPSRASGGRSDNFRAGVKPRYLGTASGKAGFLQVGLPDGLKRA